MENFDERHYITPRVDRGPLYIPPRQWSRLEWLTVGVSLLSLAISAVALVLALT